MDRQHLGRRRFGLGNARLTAPLVLLALAACQTTVAPTPAPPAPRGLESAAGQPFRSAPRSGWAVTIHKPGSGRTYCQAARAAEESDGGLGMVFRTASAESGFTLTGVTAATPGERYELTASFDQGAKLMLGARGLPGGGLYVSVPTKTYLEELAPFARGKRVTFRSATLGDLGSLALSGSSWAINASDECRILHADP
ncbi:hypothetical protein [Azospirillum doebereinerae]|uniref:Lipoprotein n=1 Tax=Azospirillum doebereinerae TaxID=92933 RepID=A0A3S0XB92_9PROT|nr:hypothetical protein [Azospirillum doebereinerae]RUQ70818.1 hypothetical protein EJ913_13745 [Azospirillum doebereinerae]